MSQHTNQSPYPQGGPHPADSYQDGQYGRPPQAPQPHHGRPARNGLGTAALILGVIGALSGVIPLLFWLAGILGLIALILGLSGRGRAKRGEATNKGVALTGAILGLVALILSVVGAVITFTAVDSALKEVDKALSGQEATTPGAKPDAKGDGKGDSKGDGAGKAGAKALAGGATAEYADKLKVTVGAPTAYTPSEYAIGHTKGNKAYKVKVTIENTGGEKFDSALSQVDARSGAEGTAAEQIYDGETTGADFTGSILPGKKATAVYAFDAPAAAKNLTVEVTPGFLDFKSSHWELKL
ncbi:DUF4352 domain-containing protein [Streptomyces sp. NPDC051561]|uniref:DUF4352 domain-containing protein n=1 Tax=Streptomyces sp. NPDC051561 TaxID=3365658 RepID=UPI0037B563F1